jgi:RNA polymerase sigma-B factor
VSADRFCTSSRADDDDLRAVRERRDAEAWTRLVERHLPLVRRLAWRYRASGEPIEDLVQSGALGLVKAIDRFDPGRGESLLAYAVPTIVGEIQRSVRDRGAGPSASRRVRELGIALRRIGDELTATLGRTPTLAELAEAADADPELTIEALLASNARITLPLEPVRGDSSADAAAPIDMLAAPDDPYALVEERSALAQALRVLDSRERTIVALSFFGELSQPQIAARLGISQMHVSRVLRRALAKARSAADPPLRPAGIDPSSP